MSKYLDADTGNVKPGRTAKQAASIAAKQAANSAEQAARAAEGRERREAIAKANGVPMPGQVGGQDGGVKNKTRGVHLGGGSEEHHKAAAKYMMWNPGDSGSPRRHMFSAGDHVRRQRLARITAMEPEVVKQLTSDIAFEVKRELQKEGSIDKSAERVAHMKQSMSVAMIHAYVLRKKDLILSHAFNRWCYSASCIPCSEKSKALVAMAVMNEKVVVRLTRHSLKRIKLRKRWRSWCEGVYQKKMRRKIVRNILCRKEAGRVIIALGTWKTFAWKSAIAAQDGDSVLVRHRNRENGASRLLGRMRYRAKQICVDAWIHRAAAWKIRRVQETRIVKRYQRKTLMDTFGGWRAVADELRRKTRVMRKVAGRIQRIKVTASMNAWIEYWRERKHNKMLLTRAAKKIQSRALAGSWGGWIDYVEARCHARDLAGRVFGRLTNGVVGSAFNSWTQLIGDQKKQQLLVARCLAKIKNRCVAGAFENWIDTVEEKKEMRVKLTRAAMKMQQRVVAASMNSWIEYYDARLRAKYLAGKVFGAMLNSKLGAAWGSWWLMIKSQDAEAGEAARQQLVVQRCVAKIKNRAMDGAFSSWTSNVEEKKELRAKLARAATKMQQRVVVASMNSWIEYYDARLRAKYLAGKVFGAMLNSKLGAAWGSWWLMIKSQDAEAGEAVRQQLVVQRCLAKIKNRVAHGAFLSWTSVVEEKKELRAKMKRAAMKMKQRVVAASMNSWIEYYNLRLGARHLCGKVLNQMVSGKLSSAWRTWAVDLKDAEKDFLLTLRAERIEKQVVAKWNRNVLKSCFFEWGDLAHNRLAALREVERAQIARAADEARKKASNNRLRSRLVLKETSMAFDAWVEMATTRRHRRLLVTRSLGRLSHRTLAATFMGWRGFMTHRRHQKNVVAHSLKKLLKRVLYGSYRAWATDAKRRREARAVLQRINARQDRRLAAHGFTGWKRFQKLHAKPRCALCKRKCDRCKALRTKLCSKDEFKVFRAHYKLQELDASGPVPKKEVQTMLQKVFAPRNKGRKPPKFPTSKTAGLGQREAWIKQPVSDRPWSASFDPDPKNGRNLSKHPQGSYAPHQIPHVQPAATESDSSDPEHREEKEDERRRLPPLMAHPPPSESKKGHAVPRPPSGVTSARRGTYYGTYATRSNLEEMYEASPAETGSNFGTRQGGHRAIVEVPKLKPKPPVDMSNRGTWGAPKPPPNPRAPAHNTAPRPPKAALSKEEAASKLLQQVDAALSNNANNLRAQSQ